ncbi:hypothetical protein H1C71_021401, partial [Ictidomys tridecemlineatus]
HFLPEVHLQNRFRPAGWEASKATCSVRSEEPGCRLLLAAALSATSSGSLRPQAFLAGPLPPTPSRGTEPLSRWGLDDAPGSGPGAAQAAAVGGLRRLSS